MVRFSAVPVWQLIAAPVQSPTPQAEELIPSLQKPELLDRVFDRAEYRGYHAFRRASELAATAKGAVVFSQPPKDLPALLRTADQLQRFALEDAGERALTWSCACGAGVTVAVSLLRPVPVPCERCGRTIELDPALATGTSRLADPLQTEVNALRLALAEFFREAMARGWPVQVQQV